jgi:hypothetical protein
LEDRENGRDMTAEVETQRELSLLSSDESERRIRLGDNAGGTITVGVTRFKIFTPLLLPNFALGEKSRIKSSNKYEIGVDGILGDIFCRCFNFPRIEVIPVFIGLENFFGDGLSSLRLPICRRRRSS